MHGSRGRRSRFREPIRRSASYTQRAQEQQGHDETHGEGARHIHDVEALRHQLDVRARYEGKRPDRLEGVVDDADPHDQQASDDVQPGAGRRQPQPRGEGPRGARAGAEESHEQEGGRQDLRRN